MTVSVIRIRLERLKRAPDDLMQIASKIKRIRLDFSLYLHAQPGRGRSEQRAKKNGKLLNHPFQRLFSSLSMRTTQAARPAGIAPMIGSA